MDKTFKELYLAGEVEFDAIDEYTEKWGTSDSNEKLGVYLGLSPKEEDVWVSESDEALQELLDQQKRW